MPPVPPPLFLPVDQLHANGTVLSSMAINNLGMVSIWATDDFCKTMKLFHCHDISTALNLYDSFTPFKYLS